MQQIIGKLIISAIKTISGLRSALWNEISFIEPNQGPIEHSITMISKEYLARFLFVISGQ